jgi:hypothetical protein
MWSVGNTSQNNLASFVANFYAPTAGSDTTYGNAYILAGLTQRFTMEPLNNVTSTS